MEWYFRNDQPIYTQLTQQITLAILSGSIPSGGALCHGGSVRDPERQGETGPGPDAGVSLVHGAAGLQPAAGESAAGHMGGGITWQFWNAGS